MEGVSSQLIAGPLTEAGRSARVVDTTGAIEAIVAAAQPGDLVLTVGAGDITHLGPQVLQALGR